MQHEQGNSDLSEISGSLKEVKSIMDNKGIKITAQMQGVMIDTHQKWEHKVEYMPEEEKKEDGYTNQI